MKLSPKFAVLFLLIASILGSIGGVFSKFAYHSFTPYSVFMLSYFLSSLILLPIIILKKKYKIERKDFPILALALFFIVGNSLSFAVGIKYTTVIISQVLY